MRKPGWYCAGSAGQAVTVPKEWSGTWETDGYEFRVSDTEDPGYYE